VYLDQKATAPFINGLDRSVLFILWHRM